MNTFELICRRLKKEGGADKVMTRELFRRLVFVSMNGMFKYDGLPESINTELFEQFLHENGTAVLWRCPEANNSGAYTGKWIASTGDYAEEPDVYGLGTTVKAVTLNGITGSCLLPDKDCVVVWNNSAMMADTPVVEFAVDILTELFTSFKSNIIYSRLKPIFRADNDTIKAAVENAFKQVYDNEPIIVSSDNILAKMVEGQTWQDLNVLNITDPENANKLQYLVKSIDDVMRWIYGLYGQAIQGNGKMAQQTVDEVNGDTSISFILPNDMLKMRRKALEKFNGLAGTSATVDFAKAWKTEETKYVAQADKNEAEAEKMEAEAEAVEKPQTEENEEEKEGAEDEEVVQT